MSKVVEAAANAATPENLKTAQTYVDFVKTNLEPLAHQIGVSVEWLWNILVTQARVEAIVMLIILSLLFIKTIIAFIVMAKSFKKATFSNYSSGEEVNRHGIVVFSSGGIGIILSVALFIATPSMMPTIVTGLVNPQFRAIEQIVNFAKNQ